MLKRILKKESARREVLKSGMVVSDPARCVQCGICTFNCPINIDVRRHAWQGVPVVDSHCLTCGECIQRCPRGVLSFGKTDLFSGQAKDGE
jgi:NAD-dependent dihydropyrimidine dehydrogenase PreA subunit